MFNTFNHYYNLYISSNHSAVKLLLFLFTCISSMTLYSQPVEIFGGANKNVFYGKNDDSYSYFSADYHSGNGFTAGFALDSIRILRLKMRLSVQFDKYNGKFIAENNSGKAVYEKTIGEIDKSTVALGVFPLNIRIKKKVDLNIGAEVAGLIGENVSGTNHYAHIMYGDELKDLNALYDRFSSRVCYGLKGRIAYQLALSKKVLPDSAVYLLLWVIQRICPFPAGNPIDETFYLFGDKK